MKKIIFKGVLFLLFLLPAACHYEFTGPALWSHNSSAAFDAWLFLWAMAIAAPILILFVPLDSPSGDSRR